MTITKRMILSLGVIPASIIGMNVIFAWYLESKYYGVFLLSEVMYMLFFINTDLMRKTQKASRVFAQNALVLLMIAGITIRFPIAFTDFMAQSALIALAMDATNLIIFEKVLGSHFKKSFISTTIVGLIDAGMMNGYFVLQGDISIGTYLGILMPTRLLTCLCLYGGYYSVRRKIRI